MSYITSKVQTIFDLVAISGPFGRRTGDFPDSDSAEHAEERVQPGAHVRKTPTASMDVG